MHAFAIPPSFLPRLSFFVPFRVRNPLDENWNREQSRLFALQRKTTEGEAERSAVVRIRLRRVISRRGRSEREPVKRNNASKIILLPVSVKRGIYLRISGELSRFYKAQSSIPGAIPRACCMQDILKAWRLRCSLIKTWATAAAQRTSQAGRTTIFCNVLCP